MILGFGINYALGAFTLLPLIVEKLDDCYALTRLGLGFRGVPVISDGYL